MVRRMRRSQSKLVDASSRICNSQKAERAAFASAKEVVVSISEKNTITAHMVRRMRRFPSKIAGASSRVCNSQKAERSVLASSKEAVVAGDDTGVINPTRMSFLDAQ